MKKSKKMLAVEAAHGGKPLEEIIGPLLAEHGPTTTARELGISVATFHYWLLKLQWRAERVYLKPWETFRIVDDPSYSLPSPSPAYTTNSRV